MEKDNLLSKGFKVHFWWSKHKSKLLSLYKEYKDQTDMFHYRNVSHLNKERWVHTGFSVVSLWPYQWLRIPDIACTSGLSARVTKARNNNDNISSSIPNLLFSELEYSGMWLSWKRFYQKSFSMPSYCDSLHTTISVANTIIRYHP